MNDHIELVKEARRLADILEHSTLAFYACGGAARTFRTLADIVAAHDAVIHVDGRQFMEVFDEAVAACRTCDEEIEHVLDNVAFSNETDDEPRLRAAGHLAKRAVELADKAAEERVKASLVKAAVHQIESGDNDFRDADECQAEDGA